MSPDEIFFRALGLEIVSWAALGVCILLLLRKGIRIEARFWLTMFAITSLILALIGDLIQMSPESFATPTHTSRRLRIQNFQI